MYARFYTQNPAPKDVDKQTAKTCQAQPQTEKPTVVVKAEKSVPAYIYVKPEASESYSDLIKKMYAKR